MKYIKKKDHKCSHTFPFLKYVGSKRYNIRSFITQLFMTAWFPPTLSPPN